MSVDISETIEFEWFGAPVRVVTDLSGLARLIRRRWGTLVGPGTNADSAWRTYRILRSDGGTVFIGPAGERTLDRNLPGLHAYNILVGDLLGGVDEHFVFHATAVARDGRAIVVTGPSTFGKTTLGIELAHRGFRLMGDDVTVLERAGGRLLPFHRSINLRPGTRARLGEERMDAVRRARYDVIDDEWAVDPVRWLGEPPGPADVAVVVVLRPREDGAGVRRFPNYEILVMDGHESCLEGLERTPGVVRVERGDNPRFVRVAVDGARGLIEWHRTHDEVVVSSLKLPSAPPDFGGEPELERIGTSQAAIELCQEMLNRHQGSALDREYRGREAEQIADVAAALAGSRCFALVPGNLDTTLDLLVRRFEEGA